MLYHLDFLQERKSHYDSVLKTVRDVIKIIEIYNLPGIRITTVLFISHIVATYVH